MGARMLRFAIRRHDAALTKTFNNRFKTKERRRRDARMIERIKAGSLPYTPEVMSWLSLELERPASRITPADVQALLKSSLSA